MSVRSVSRVRARASAATLEARPDSAHLPEPVLQFDFEGKRAAAPVTSAPRAKDASIKEAIIRWLNEQL